MVKPREPAASSKSPLSQQWLPAPLPPARSHWRQPLGSLGNHLRGAEAGQAAGMRRGREQEGWVVGTQVPRVPILPSQALCSWGIPEGPAGTGGLLTAPLSLGNKSFNEEGAGWCISQPTLPLPALTAVSNLYPEHILSQRGETDWDCSGLVQEYRVKTVLCCHNRKECLEQSWSPPQRLIPVPVPEPPRAGRSGVFPSRASVTKTQWKEGCVHREHPDQTTFRYRLSSQAGFLLLLAAQAYTKDPHPGKESNFKTRGRFLHSFS